MTTDHWASIGLVLTGTCVGSLLGCTSATVPRARVVADSAREYAITVDRASLTLERRGSWIWFVVTATVRNTSSAPLHVMRCGIDAQRRVDDRWVTVWTEPCVPTQMAPTGLLRGDSLVRTLTVVGPTNPTDPLRIDPRCGPGLFRLVLPLSRQRTSLGLANVPSESARASPTITVEAAREL